MLEAWFGFEDKGYELFIARLSRDFWSRSWLLAQTCVFPDENGLIGWILFLIRDGATRLCVYQ